MSDVDAWEDAGLVEVLLPSGRRVRGVLPALMELARRQLIPADLVAWVISSADPKWLADPEPDPDLDAKVQGWLDELVVLFVRQVEIDGAWHDKTLDAARLDRLPAGERETLEWIVTFRLTPAQASERSARILAGEDPDSPDDLEVERGVNRLREFRQGRDRDPLGSDSVGVEDPPEPVSRPDRTRRVSGRRSARGAAPSGHAESVGHEAEVGDATR